MNGMQDGVFRRQARQGPRNLIGPAGAFQEQPLEIRRDIAMGRHGARQEQKSAMAPTQEGDHHLVPAFGGTASIHEAPLGNDQGRHLGRFAPLQSQVATGPGLTQKLQQVGEGKIRKIALHRGPRGGRPTPGQPTDAAGISGSRRRDHRRAPNHVAVA